MCVYVLACMYVCMYACMHTCKYVCMYVCTCVHMQATASKGFDECVRMRLSTTQTHISVYIYIYMQDNAFTCVCKQACVDSRSYDSWYMIPYCGIHAWTCVAMAGSRSTKDETTASDLQTRCCEQANVGMYIGNELHSTATHILCVPAKHLSLSVSVMLISRDKP